MDGLPDADCAYKRLKLAEVFSDIDRAGFSGAKARPAQSRATSHERDPSFHVLLYDLLKRRLRNPLFSAGGFGFFTLSSC